MQLRARLLLALGLASLPLTSVALQIPQGLSFSNKDWQLACDNTRTCRAAGYQADEAELPVSLLLTRKAGPHQPVTGRLMLGNYDNEALLKTLPAAFPLAVRINGRDLGTLAMTQDTLVAELSPPQVAALLATLAQKSSIRFETGALAWQLSDQGAASVLLKMDEFQGRIGSPGALVRKGSRDEAAVRAAVPEPVLHVAALAAAKLGDAAFVAAHKGVLHQALLARLGNDDPCPDLLEAGPDAELVVDRLDAHRLLVSTRCWLAAYNAGDGFWVIDDAPPFSPRLVTTAGSEYDQGRIVAMHKGRGLGDCWSREEWVWDGTGFVHTASSTSGLCRLIAAGGAWSLPTRVTQVRSTKP